MSLPRHGSNPHRLADEFLSTNGRDPRHRLTWRYWQDQFWHWDGTRYILTSESDFRALLTSFVDHQFATNNVPTSYSQDLKPVTSAQVTNVTRALEGKTLVPETIDQPAWLGSETPDRTFIAVKNGLLDVDKLLAGHRDALRGHTPEWFSRVCLPFAFDPTAQCPRWSAFLNEVLEEDAERVALLQEWFGYCLTPDTTQQKFLVFEGEGANGKSVVCEILTALLGKDNVSHVQLELFNQRFQLTPTIGKLANIATETGEINRVAEGILKAFTSGDRMYFDRKGVSGVEAYPTARLVLATNNRPRFSDRSEGLWRRMLLMPFLVTIPVDRQDRQLTAKLCDELPGIFLWAVEGLRRLRAQGCFTEPTVCRQSLEEYKLESNPAKQFLLDRYSETPDGWIFSGEIYDEYVVWCQQNGYHALSASAFGKEVARVFPGSERKKRARSGTGKREWSYAGIGPVPGAPGAPGVSIPVKLAQAS